ncbi:MAG: class I SAM-dependent DNA methyltransferase [Planctomycetaceae bacterium]|nr:class I SAM-dependent DNA methyltransferase [Planctomycetaceae bacterium]
MSRHHTISRPFVQQRFVADAASVGSDAGSIRHGQPFDPARVAQFLMRCLFTMFAEDVDLLPRGSFTELLKSLRSDIATLPQMLRSLWESMDKGGFSPILRKKLRWFNGGLFEDCEALPLREAQLDLLIEASQANWRDVEPAIFGTLLERALDPIERHKLGAHFTPRAYVERLVLPTIIEPLRAEWDAVRAAAVTLAKRGETPAAIETVRDFHRKLCETRVLDPACGTGNFLYVALEHMKRLEGEVLNLLRDLGYMQTEIITVDPHQFLGIEVNPRAAAIADLVLWIGYLQWHLRTRDLSQLQEPIIRKFHNIECRDAVLAWDSVAEVRDGQGQPVTRWDGRTTKRHPVTGEQVPDETARVPVLKYLNPRKAEWPHADYIVGNPPFVGTRRMRLALGDGYVEALTVAHPIVPENADLVMYWWHMAAEQVADGHAKQFGLITTNSITQTFNRGLLRHHLQGSKPVSLMFAIPDHPWVEASDGAAVRVGMTVGAEGHSTGVLLRVANEITKGDLTEITFDPPIVGHISEDLRTGASPATAVPLNANGGVAYWGVKFYGDGFIVTPEEAAALATQQAGRTLARPFISGRDLTANRRNHLAIDCDGLQQADLLRDYPATYQWLLERVKPVREHNPRAFKRERWWIFGENQPGMRRAVAGLPRFIATTETAKHRVFHLFGKETLAEGTVTVFALPDVVFFGVLSSRIHVVWAMAAGGRLGVGNDPRYNKTRCFDPFPFPAATESQQQRIRELGEQLDAHRKRQQATHPGLTMTGMYNVLEKLRAGEPLAAKEQSLHEQGLVSVLQQLHDELDAAVFDAYGWPASLTDEEILERLVALNAARAAEEQQGLIRWLRPEFQNPTATPKQQTLALPEPDDEEAAADTNPRRKRGTKVKAAPKTSKQKPLAGASGLSGETTKSPWPKSLPDQIQAVRQFLLTAAKPITAAELAKLFLRGNADRIEEVLQSLVITGNARRLRGGKFVAS